MYVRNKLNNVKLTPKIRDLFNQYVLQIEDVSK
jgi:hypothetical protein